jgi:hypothetical protein
MIEEAFLRFATDILGATDGGLTGTEIINYSVLIQYNDLLSIRRGSKQKDSLKRKY